LKGIIIYWGAHYYAFFRVFSDGKEQWLRVDDKAVTKKTNWKDIVSESVDAMVTPTIILFEKYKESVLAPSIYEMEREFKMDRYSLRSMMKEAVSSKRKANYKDCRLDFVMQDSNNSSSKSIPEEEVKNDSRVEKRDRSNSREENKLKNYDKKSSDDDNQVPVRDVQPISPPVKEDEWICEK